LISSVDALAQAIAQNEGYNVAGSLPNTLNNPGDLESNGTLNSYSTPASGWAALESKLNNIASGNSTTYPASETLGQFASTYTGGNPTAASNIASSLGNGVTPSSIMSDILGAGVGVATGDALGSAGDWISQLFGNSDTIVVRISVIVAGLIFIAGALFSFDSVKTTVINTAKTTAKGAAEAAA
jgi:hypothetical protein